MMKLSTWMATFVLLLASVSPAVVWAQTPEPAATVEAASPQAPQVCEVDDRSLSSDPRVGRLSYSDGAGGVTPFCTAWLVANGAILTAGHCVDVDADQSGPMLTDGNSDWAGQTVVLEFDVPLSDNTGNPQPATPQNTFTVNVNAVQFFYPGIAPDNPVGIGRDWALFTVQPNAGRLPHQTRGFFRVTNRQPDTGSVIHVTGFGIDNEPTRDQAQQSAGGDYEGEVTTGDGVYHEYTTYTQSGASGGPIIWIGPDYAMGIHTHGRCEEGFLGIGNNYNKGTSFDYAPLGIALNNFQGPGTVHVDRVGHPGTPNGWIFNPYNSVGPAVAAAGSGARISIVAGNYPETMVINKPVILTAPVGTVVIGQ
jgi:hypothetical protein